MSEQTFPSAADTIRLWCGKERRASVRFPCGCRSRVRVLRSPKRAFPGVLVEDVSVWGVGLLFPAPLWPGAILALEPEDLPRPRLLLARVIYRRLHPGGWLHGCQLASPLTEAELHALRL
jgi:hypothetical protein